MSFNLPTHNLQELTLEAFVSMFKNIFEKYSVLKKYLRANHSKFVTKELIIWKSKLRKIFLKDRTEESRCKYKKQKNVCVFLLKKAKKDY